MPLIVEGEGEGEGKWHRDGQKFSTAVVMTMASVPITLGSCCLRGAVHSGLVMLELVFVPYTIDLVACVVLSALVL